MYHGFCNFAGFGKFGLKEAGLAVD